MKQPDRHLIFAPHACTSYLHLHFLTFHSCTSFLQHSHLPRLCPERATLHSPPQPPHPFILCMNSQPANVYTSHLSPPSDSTMTTIFLSLHLHLYLQSSSSTFNPPQNTHQPTQPPPYPLEVLCIFFLHMCAYISDACYPHLALCNSLLCRLHLVQLSCWNNVFRLRARCQPSFVLVACFSWNNACKNYMTFQRKTFTFHFAICTLCTPFLKHVPPP